MWNHFTLSNIHHKRCQAHTRLEIVITLWQRRAPTCILCLCLKDRRILWFNQPINCNHCETNYLSDSQYLREQFRSSIFLCFVVCCVAQTSLSYFLFIYVRITFVYECRNISTLLNVSYYPGILLEKFFSRN